MMKGLAAGLPSWREWKETERERDLSRPLLGDYFTHLRYRETRGNVPMHLFALLH